MKGATDIAYEAVRKYGMWGPEAGFMSTDNNEVSQELNSVIDERVRQILKESAERVTKLLTKREIEVRDLSKNLFWFDYLDSDEIEKVIKKQKLDKAAVRQWDYATQGEYVIKF